MAPFFSILIHGPCTSIEVEKVQTHLKDSP